MVDAVLYQVCEDGDGSISGHQRGPLQESGVARVRRSPITHTSRCISLTQVYEFWVHSVFLLDIPPAVMSPCGESTPSELTANFL